MSENPPIKDHAQDLIQELDALYESGAISVDEWHARMAAVIVPAYLTAQNPRAQSGHSGDEAQWKQARGLIAEAVHKPGSFLDVGCANGHLLESVQTWSPHKLELHGLDISPELIELARGRAPRFQFHVGNARTWISPRAFDFVRTGLEYVPTAQRRAYVHRLMRDLVAPGGRLIIGVFNEEVDRGTTADQVGSWGFAVSGLLERPHRRDRRLSYRLLWVDRD